MKNVLHKNNWSAGVVKLHVWPPPSTLIKIKPGDKSEEFLLFVCYFNITPDVSEIIDMDVKFQYFHALLCGEALRKFDTLSDYVDIITPLTVEAITLVLGKYFFAVNSLPKKSARCAAE